MMISLPKCKMNFWQCTAGETPVKCLETPVLELMDGNISIYERTWQIRIVATTGYAEFFLKKRFFDSRRNHYIEGGGVLQC